jgi:hypothetical protein
MWKNERISSELAKTGTSCLKPVSERLQTSMPRTEFKPAEPFAHRSAPTPIGGENKVLYYEVIKCHILRLEFIPAPLSMSNYAYDYTDCNQPINNGHCLATWCPFWGVLLYLVIGSKKVIFVSKNSLKKMCVMN